MGDKTGMDCGGKTIRLYSVQSDVVYEIIQRDGVCFSKPEYVRKKYGESAAVFLEAYGWFSREAQKLVSRPSGSAYPYWAFEDRSSLEWTGGRLLTLMVPKEEAVLFDMYGWNRILQLKYMGETRDDERRFQEELEARGLREYDVMLTGFYPEQKALVEESWKRLFCHHEALRAGERFAGQSVQAGLWQIKREWIVKAE